jgi:hypothetical protein
MNSLKIVYIIPRLEMSPATTMLMRRIVEMKKDSHDVYIVEWTKTPSLHRDKVMELVDNNHFLTLGTPNELTGFLLDVQPDIIHFEEMPENLEPVMPKNLYDWIYDPQKNWRIVETSHTSAADAICRKQWEPDAFYLHSLDQVENQFALMRSPLFLIQFPIDVEDSSESMSTQEILGDFKISGEKKHIVNIGPFTEANNQDYFLSIAQKFWETQGDKYQFHLVGPMDHQVDLLALPPNVIAWGEQVDVWKWLRVADIMLHTTIQDIDPFQCRQAMAYGVRMIALPLRSYRDQYDGIFTPMTGNLDADVFTLHDRLNCGCPSPKPINGEDNIRFRQQLSLTYHDLLQEKPSRDAVEQPPHQLSIEWHNGPIVTNLSDRECEVSWKVGDKHGDKILLSDERQTRFALPLREDASITVKWEDREERHAPYLKGAHVLLELKNETLGATLAAVEAIAQWSIEKGLGKVWLRSAFHDIINWGWYTRKAKVAPMWPTEWSIWKPEVDMTQEINLTDGDWLEEVGKQLGVKVEERLQFVTLRAVSRPTQNRYVIVSNQGSSLSLDAWQEIIDIHKRMGRDILSVGMTLKDAIRIDGNWGHVWNALHWADYLICGAGDHMWLGISAGKKVLVHDEGQPHHAGSMVTLVDSNNILKDEYFKDLEVNK